ncbi:MAG: hypothetical protein WC884_02050 [Candidatus Paceibacterota bacterium]
MNYELRIKKSRNAGYTIIETMIAVSLFVIIIMIGMGSLLNAYLLNQKSQNMRSIMDNLSFIMEDMGKNLRTGYNYHCFTSSDVIPSATSNTMSVPKSCANGWAISFESATGISSNDSVSDIKDNDQWVYYINNGKIWKSTQGPYTNPPNFVQLTPDEVVINSISGFSVLGAESITTDSQQPFVIIRLVGTITLKGVVSPFSLQTSVSQRMIDI